MEQTRRGRPPKKAGLPNNPNEFESALAPYRPMVRPALIGLSKVCEVVGVQKLDGDEIEGGTVAFSGLMYQYGGQLDARVLVALWLIGVTLPRAIQKLTEKPKQNATIVEVQATGTNAQ